MFNNLDQLGRSRAFIALAELAPPAPDPQHGPLRAWAETVALWPAGGPLTPPILWIMAQELALHVAMSAGPHGHGVVRLSDVTRAAGDAAAAMLVLRMAGLTPEGGGCWREADGGATDPVDVAVPVDLFAKSFAEWAGYFAAPFADDADDVPG